MSLTLRDIERFIAYSEVMPHLANLKQIEQSVEGHLAIAVDIDAAAIRRSWLGACVGTCLHGA